MTPQEQRIAIAEWRGWTAIREQDYCDPIVNPYDGPILQFWQGVNPDTGDEEELPDYGGDLNAIAEAVGKLPYEKQSIYMNILTFKVLMKEEGVSDFDRHQASAAQRTEALCRTLWPERWT